MLEFEVIDQFGEWSEVTVDEFQCGNRPAQCSEMAFIGILVSDNLEYLNVFHQGNKMKMTGCLIFF